LVESVTLTVADAAKALELVDEGQLVRVPTRSEAETARFAEALGRALGDGAVLALSGPLGAGKTAFVRGLAVGLGLPRGTPITSPSYALVNTYNLPNGEVFYHADLYRLGDDPGELEALGFRDWLAEARCVAIEWAEQSADALEATDLMIVIEDHGPQERVLRLSRGPRATAAQ